MLARRSLRCDMIGPPVRKTRPPYHISFAWWFWSRAPFRLACRSISTPAIRWATGAGRPRSVTIRTQTVYGIPRLVNVAGASRRHRHRTGGRAGERGWIGRGCWYSLLSAPASALPKWTVPAGQPGSLWRQLDIRPSGSVARSRWCVWPAFRARSVWATWWTGWAPSSLDRSAFHLFKKEKKHVLSVAQTLFTLLPPMGVPSSD